MPHFAHLLLPILVLSPLLAGTSECAIPGAVEMRPGVFILKGGATPSLYPALTRQRITHIIDLRADGEITAESAFQFTLLQDMKIQYMRYATSHVPPIVDLDFVRTLLKALPAGSRIVVTCVNGNRAAAAVCPWLVLDQGMEVEEAMTASSRAGLRMAETEVVIRKYMRDRM
ncbi:hypothetical protein GETHLI_31980 [Geothrix limicola]|uniref:Uncharacterized protein n=1 Tax=Geothrix limicola TaxID=2927978 RepID=A0ABQ5QK55_9BACT|nr:hypothetical protein [Geothrix limicola]GLH74696.1 hypothetical protein GETHLI_31980 [Geothrix limicola]